MTAPRPGRSSIGVRVRPNASDFIKDLERQLRTKKQTFYVDVDANLKPANKTIAEWSRTTLKKIRAVVPVDANTHQATVAVADWRRKQRGIQTKIPVTAELGKAYAQVLTFRKIAGKDIEVNLRINTDSADKAAQRFEQAIARRGISIPVDVDPNAMQRTAKKIDTDLIRRLQSQGGVLIGVDADTRAAQAKVDRFASQSPKVESQLDLDTKKANLELKLLKIRAAKERLEVGVGVNRRSIDQVLDAFGEIEKRVGNLTVLRSLDLGPVTLGKPTGLIGTLTTITALAGAVPAAVTAVTALSKVLVDLAGAASILPGALGGVLASLGTFTLGVSGVSDTLGALFDVWTEGASEQASTARRSIQAHNQLTNAIDDEADAQRDVAKARKQATTDLRNLNNELRGSVLNEAQALLDVQKARDRLAEGGFDSLTDLKQAQLDEAQALHNLDTVRERNIQLQQKANEENAKGVEGSDAVQQALENQTRAAQSTAQALEAIASTQATGAMGKFNDLFGQLTPNAQAFIEVIAGAKGEFFALRNELQETIFQGLAPGLQQTLGSILPVLRPGMQAIAQGLNQNILAVFDSLSSPAGQSIIERILGGTAEAQKALTNLVDPLVRGFGTLIAAGAEHLPQVVDLFVRLADRFADFIETADRTGSLDTFMDRGLKALEQIAEIGINAIKIVNDLSNAFEGDLLQTIVDLTDRLHEFLSSPEGQQDMKDFISEAKGLWEEWKPILKELPGLFSAISDAARAVLDFILPPLRSFLEFLAEHPTLVSTFFASWLGAKVLVGALSPFLHVLNGLIAAASKIPGVVGALNKVPGVNPTGKPGGLGSSATSGRPGSVQQGGAMPGGPRGPSAPGPVGGAAAAISRLLGPAGIAAGVTLAVLDESRRADFYDAWQAERNAATDEATRREIDKEVYKQLNIDIGDEPSYPVLSKFQFKTMAGGGPGGRKGNYRVENGKLINVDTGDEVPMFTHGGYTDWAKTVGRPALLHGGEFIEPADTVQHYGVDAMEALRQRRVPKQVLQSFQFGGLFPWMPPLAPHLGDDHGITPAPPVAPPAPFPGLTEGQGSGPAIGPPPTAAPAQQPMSPTEYGPMAEQKPQQSFSFMGFDIPLGGSPETTPPNFSDPNIWPFGIPGVGAPGTTAEDAGKWLADWGAKTLMGFGEAVLGGVLGFFGAEGVLNSPYFNAIRQTVGYFSSLPGAVSNATGPGAEQTALGVDNALNTYYGLPGNPPGGAAPPGIPQVFDPNTGQLLPATQVPARNSEANLQPHTTAMLRTIERQFPQLGTIGGYREDPHPDHPGGRGLDVMIPNHNTPEGKAFGDQVNAWVKANAGVFGVKYTLWQTHEGGNHFDHIHIGFNDDPASASILSGGGVPVAPAQQGQDPTAHMGGPPSYPAGGDWWGGSNGPMPQSNTESVRNRGVPLGFRRTPRKTQTAIFPGFSGAPISQELTGRPEYQQNGSVVSQQLDPGTGQRIGSKEQLKAIAKQLYLQSGMPAAEWPAFERLIEKESSWNPTAKNPSSTAYGLGQFLDITDAKYGPRSPDPMVQLPRIFQYLRDRYGGSPAKALQFHNQKNWYDRGGWLPPGQSHVANNTGKPELIVPFDQLLSFQGGGFLPLPPGLPSVGGGAGHGVGGGAQFNPGIQIDTSTTEVFNPLSVAQGLVPQHRMFAPDEHGNVWLDQWAAPQYSPAGSYHPMQNTRLGSPFALPAQLDPTKPGFEGAFKMPSFQFGGLNKLFPRRAIAPGPIPTPPRPRGPEARKIAPGGPRPGTGRLQPAYPGAPERSPLPPLPPPAAPPPAPTAGPGVPTPEPTVRGVQIGPGPGTAATGSAGGQHLHPAAQKGIRSGFATAGNIASMVAGAAGIPGAGLIGGAFGQAGKIVEGIANVGASFLVGTLTNGTTENPYGVTQRGSQPTGGTTTVVDRSVNMGDVTTQDPDYFFKQMDLRDAQSRAMLGRFG